MNISEIKRYRNVEYLQYMSYIIDIVNKEDTETLGLAVALQELEAGIAPIASIFKQRLGSALTKEIESLDRLRNKNFIGLKTQVKSYTYHFDENISTAAELVQKAMTLQEVRISKINYHNKTFTITSLLDNLNSDASLLAAVNTLGIANWLAVLGDVNNTFKEVYLQRIDETAASPTVNIATLRETSNLAFENLFKTISSESFLRKEEVYQNLLDKIENLTQKYNALTVSNAKADSDVIIDDAFLEAMPIISEEAEFIALKNNEAS